MQQLDIFADSRDLMLRNDVLEPLQRRDAAAAQTALELLAGEYPDDGALSAMTVLVCELGRGSTASFADHAALAIARRYLEVEVMPAARRVLPVHAIQPWLAPCWRSLARRAGTLAFRGAEADSHAAPLWLLAHDWTAARESVEGIESWWRIPVPLMWMAEARYRADGLDAAWPLLAELAWLAPARFLALLPGLGDASLDALHQRFDAEFFGSGEPDDYAWFPAWLLVVKPALAGRLEEARVQRDQAASRAMVLLGEVLRREHEGDQHALIALRQELRRLHAGLFDAYMATRKVQHR
ncbi:hypothetical protein GNZ12_10720 [Paraburkholderia sp. 1N]|uniref:Uncharacterized protein n=1 Tax=Paraburkholderia solitsugae TaxID=2675748 RepID=A0ABX2BM02_9BURK|nr:hypothetical protein [Paraburkholderia solitsugae]NPT41781.1 hypothetical protein [Paraburkholderia solitsugae]